MDDIIIVGGGIGGLTLGLALHAAGIPCRIFESAAEIRPIGVGINLLPHATKELAALGLEPALAKVAIATKDATFFNRFGQLIYQEPLGRAAGLRSAAILDPSRRSADGVAGSVSRSRRRRPAGDQPSLHRRRAGRVRRQRAFFRRAGRRQPHTVRGRAAIACDGINSAIRKQFFPGEGEPRYSGINMWRGVTRWKPILSGASMVRAGWLSHGKMVIYPIRAAGADGLQLDQLGRGNRNAGLSQARLEPARLDRRFHRRRSPTGISTGSTCPRSFAPPTACWNSRWSIRTRCRAGVLAG